MNSYIRWQMISVNHKNSGNIPVKLSTVELPSFAIGLMGRTLRHLYETCALYEDGRSEILMRATTMSEAVSWHYKFIKKYHIRNVNVIDQ